MEKNFTIIFGTRPEYLKLKCLMDEFKNRQITYQVIYVSQHENIDEIMDISFIKLQIEKTTPDRLSNIGSEILDLFKDSLEN